MPPKGSLLVDQNGGPAHEAPSGIWSSWRETLVVSASFMSAYTAYLALQSLQSSLNQEQGLGVVSLACLYGTIILSGILTPPFIRLVGPKWTLVVAWVCHSVYTASNFYPTWSTLIPASILLGAIAGPMWTAQGLYITTNGERIAKTTGQKLHSILSKLNGVFFMCYESTQITGNLISSLVLKQGSYTDTNVTRWCGADNCPTAGNGTEIAEPEPQIVYILLGVFLVCDVVGLALTVFLLPPLHNTHAEVSIPGESTEQPGLGKTLVSWCTALSDPKLLCLVPFFLSCAMSQGILFADFTKAFISCSLGVSMVGFIMAAHGAITSVIAIVSSQIAKYTGRYGLFAIAFTCNISMVLTLLLWKPDSDNIAPFFAIPIIWGVAVGIFHAQFNSLVGMLFPEKKPSAFANYHTWNAIGYTITFAYGGVLCVRTKLYVCLGAVVFGILGYTGAEVLYARQTRASLSRGITHPGDTANENVTFLSSHKKQGDFVKIYKSTTQG
ncbi:protein unc-93 homolog A-like [Haliotis rufescens]|uniref:protein unc-93 homolog A-like n=1 Tax=Haliotis rufescens TaxID=6454 RepID=UPI001EB06F2D|nr:protein unc-93 homolog A-like [Haliotis rufescens]XP_046382068.1 protein unc-93 homolog A-like [Haliotis rufescens]